MSLAGAIKAGLAYIELTVDSKKVQDGLSKAQNSIKNFGISMQSVGGDLIRMATMFSLPMAYAVKKFADFDDSMRSFQAITRATEAQFELMSNKAKQLGATSAFTSKQVADCMVSLARMGFTVDEVSSSIENVLRLTRATGSEIYRLADIAGITVAVMRDFKLSAEDTSDVCDVLAYAANNSALDIFDLGEAIKIVGPVANVTGDSVRDVTANLMALANAGIRGSLAGTSLRKVYQALAEQSSDEAKQLRNMRIELQNLNGDLRKPAEVLRDLAIAIENMRSGEKINLAVDVFDLRGSLGALPLLSNISELSKFRNELNNVTGISKIAADRIEGGLGGALRYLWSRLEAVSIAIGNAFDVKLRKSLDNIVKFLDCMKNWINMNQESVAKTTVFMLSLFGVGTALMTVGIILKSIAFSIQSVTMLWHGMNGAVLLLNKSFQVIYKSVMSLSKSFDYITKGYGKFTVLTKSLSDKFTILARLFTSGTTALLNFLSSGLRVFNVFPILFGYSKSAVTGLSIAFISLLSSVAKFISIGVTGLSTAFISLSSSVARFIGICVRLSAVFTANTFKVAVSPVLSLARVFTLATKSMLMNSYAVTRVMNVYYNLVAFITYFTSFLPKHIGAMNTFLLTSRALLLFPSRVISYAMAPIVSVMSNFNKIAFLAGDIIPANLRKTRIAFGYFNLSMLYAVKGVYLFGISIQRAVVSVVKGLQLSIIGLGNSIKLLVSNSINLFKQFVSGIAVLWNATRATAVSFVSLLKPTTMYSNAVKVMNVTLFALSKVFNALIVAQRACAVSCVFLYTKVKSVVSALKIMAITSKTAISAKISNIVLAMSYRVRLLSASFVRLIQVVKSMAICTYAVKAMNMAIFASSNVFSALTVAQYAYAVACAFISTKVNAVVNALKMMAITSKAAITAEASTKILVMSNNVGLLTASFNKLFRVIKALNFSFLVSGLTSSGKLILSVSRAVKSFTIAKLAVGFSMMKSVSASVAGLFGGLWKSVRVLARWFSYSIRHLKWFSLGLVKLAAVALIAYGAFKLLSYALSKTDFGQVLIKNAKDFWGNIGGVVSEAFSSIKQSLSMGDLSGAWKVLFSGLVLIIAETTSPIVYVWKSMLNTLAKGWIHFEYMIRKSAKGLGLLFTMLNPFSSTQEQAKAVENAINSNQKLDADKASMLQALDDGNALNNDFLKQARQKHNNAIDYANSYSGMNNALNYANEDFDNSSSRYKMYSMPYDKEAKDLLSSLSAKYKSAMEDKSGASKVNKQYEAELKNVRKDGIVTSKEEAKLNEIISKLPVRIVEESIRAAIQVEKEKARIAKEEFQKAITEAQRDRKIDNSEQAKLDKLSHDFGRASTLSHELENIISEARNAVGSTRSKMEDMRNKSFGSYSVQALNALIGRNNTGNSIAERTASYTSKLVTLHTETNKLLNKLRTDNPGLLYT